MLKLRSFFSGLFGFIKSISKKVYRNCAVLTAGMIIMAVIALTSNDFGGSGKSKAMSPNKVVTEAGTEELEIEEAANVNPDLPAIQMAELETTEIETAQAVVAETAAAETPASVTGIEVSSGDYDALCRIVQAEAGGEDEMGRIMVANVVLNRVKSEKFPGTITEVIYERSNGIPQFQPTNKQSFETVEASESTRICVDRALAGEDYAQGALFFAVRTSPDSWFNTSLTFLFEYSGHYFYR